MTEGPDIQRKPPFKAESGFGFENGERVPVTPTPTDPPELALLLELLDAGAVFPDMPAAVAVVERHFDLNGDARAAETLHRLFQNLKGKKGREIRLALAGAWGRTLQAEADDQGVTKQTLAKNVERIRARIFGKRLTAATPIGT
ncbi:MAG: hypothetical protein ABSF51_12730 [Verrucomicrobiota bacterium]